MPGSVLITPNGCTKPVDFGIVWKAKDREKKKGKETGAELGDIWT